MVRGVGYEQANYLLSHLRDAYAPPSNTNNRSRRARLRRISFWPKVAEERRLDASKIFNVTQSTKRLSRLVAGLRRPRGAHFVPGGQKCQVYLAELGLYVRSKSGVQS